MKKRLIYLSATLYLCPFLTGCKKRVTSETREEGFADASTISFQQFPAGLEEYYESLDYELRCSDLDGKAGLSPNDREMIGGWLAPFLNFQESWDKFYCQERISNVSDEAFETETFTRFEMMTYLPLGNDGRPSFDGSGVQEGPEFYTETKEKIETREVKPKEELKWRSAIDLSKKESLKALHQKLLTELKADPKFTDNAKDWIRNNGPLEVNFSLDIFAGLKRIRKKGSETWVILPEQTTNAVGLGGFSVAQILGSRPPVMLADVFDLEYGVTTIVNLEGDKLVFKDRENGTSQI